jgi:hypothetical protein
MPNETHVLLKAPETAVGAVPWRMVFVADLGEDDGDCDYKTNTIRLHADLAVAGLVETICHEGGHLTLPDIGERAIKRLGKNLVVLLFACPRLKITLADGD